MRRSSVPWRRLRLDSPSFRSAMAYPLDDEGKEQGGGRQVKYRARACRTSCSDPIFEPPGTAASAYPPPSRRSPKAGLMSVRARTSMFALLCAATIIAFAPTASAQDAPVFVGTWSLNMDKTEPARDKVIEEPEGTGAGR